MLESTARHCHVTVMKQETSLKVEGSRGEDLPTISERQSSMGLITDESYSLNEFADGKLLVEGHLFSAHLVDYVTVEE